MKLGIALSRLTYAFEVSAPARGLGADVRLSVHCYYAEGDGEPVAQAEIEEVGWLEYEDCRAALALAAALEKLAPWLSSSRSP